MPIDGLVASAPPNWRGNEENNPHDIILAVNRRTLDHEWVTVPSGFILFVNPLAH